MCKTLTLAQQLTNAFAFFNRELFEDRLPDCFIITHRKRGALGYFWAEQWQRRNGQGATHEISLNPDTFKGRTMQDILSTLVHEMCHLEQQEFGKPSRNGYHNKEWGAMMRRVGLIPSSTAKPGGKETGQRVSHYVEEGGAFEGAAKKLLKLDGFSLDYATIGRASGGAAKKKRESKTKYSCVSCGQNAWAKPDAHLICGDCKKAMLAA